MLISANGAVNDALAESEERFRRLVEALPDALYVHSEGRIVFVNPFGMRLVGARPAQLVGKAILEIIHPDFRELIGGESNSVTRQEQRLPQWRLFWSRSTAPWWR